jgi:alpha-L-arabinofuranosidase
MGDLDIAAAWTINKRAITIAIVNPDSKDEQVTVDFGTTSLKPKTTRWLISNPDPESYNEPGKTQNVVIKQEKVTIENSTLPAPADSVCLYRLEQ